MRSKRWPPILAVAVPAEETTASAAIEGQLAGLGLTPDHLKSLLPKLHELVGDKLPPEVVEQIQTAFSRIRPRRGISSRPHRIKSLRPSPHRRRIASSSEPFIVSGEFLRREPSCDDKLCWPFCWEAWDSSSTAPARAQTAARPSDDEQAIRKDVEEYAEAYNKGDIDSAGRHWTDDAEYINDEGKIDQGPRIDREPVQTGPRRPQGIYVQRAGAVRANAQAGCGSRGWHRHFDRARRHAGKDRVSRPSCSRATANGGSRRVQDLPSLAETEEPTPYQKLKQLEWLVGQWQDEEKDTDIHMTCRWAPGTSFLVQEYVIKRPNHETLEINQRIAWDPTNDQLRSWIFDSRGGFSDGAWQRNGNQWNVAVWACCLTGIGPRLGKCGRSSTTSTSNGRPSIARSTAARLTDSTVKFRRVEPNQTAAAETKAP